MIIKMELSAIGMIMLIVIIRTFFIELFPKKTFIILWHLVVCRLLIPYTIPFRLNIYSLIYNYFEKKDCIRNDRNYAVKVQLLLEENEKVLLVIWALGCFIVATRILLTHWKYRQIYKTALPISSKHIEEWKKEHKLWRRINILQLDRVDSPFTYGIFNPVIILPKSIMKLENEQIEYALLHEYMHIKHFDILFKWVLVICICIHWFNPFVWVLYVYANRDIELNCDEYVLNTMDISYKSKYAMTLICLEEMRNYRMPLCSQFCQKASEERIEAIMKSKEITRIERVFAAFLVCAIIMGFGTSVSASTEVKYETENDMNIDLSIPTVTIRENKNDGTFSAVAVDQNHHVIYVENGINLDSQATMEYVYGKILN